MASRKQPTRPGQLGSVGRPFTSSNYTDPSNSAKPRRLGKSLQDVMDRMDQGSDLSRGKVDPVTGKRKPPTNLSMGANALLPSGPDFEVYWVSPTDEYYQGPGLSTCVVAHVFIPTENPPSEEEQESVEEGIDNLSSQFSSVKRWDKTAMGVSFSMFGYTYVMFRNRRGITSGVYKYGPMPLHVYRTFREYSSKGRGVKQILEPFGYSKSTWPV